MSSHVFTRLHDTSSAVFYRWRTPRQGRVRHGRRVRMVAGLGGGRVELSHNDTPLSVAARLPCPNDAAACVFLLTHYGMPVLSSAGAGSGGLGSSLVVGGGKGGVEGGSSSGVASNSMQTMSPRMALFYKVGNVW